MDIDIIIPWVDGDDPEWIELYNKYSPLAKSTDDIRSIRYKDYGLLKYWFRSIEKNATWFRKIHFITTGQKPEWLNIHHPKLNWVKHEDYIPKKYLPVFSANPIECNMHRIKGLSENFVYFNDDMYLLKPVKENFFFNKSLPCDFAISNIPKCEDLVFSSMIVHVKHEINKHFDKYACLKKHAFKWLNIKYGFNILRTFFLLPWNHHTGFYDHHMPQPFIKKTFNEVWDKCNVALDRTSSSKLRSITDVNQYLFRYWQLCTGSFSPVKFRNRGNFIHVKNVEKNILDVLINNKASMVCINDSQLENPVETYSKVIEYFESNFPEKSSFEL